MEDINCFFLFKHITFVTFLSHHFFLALSLSLSLSPPYISLPIFWNLSKQTQVPAKYARHGPVE